MPFDTRVSMGPRDAALRRWACFLIVAWLLVLAPLNAMAEVAVPTLVRPVTDQTATLSAAQVASLENQLAAFEARKGSQIAVLIVPTTAPEDIAQFGIRVAEQWKIGRAKVDDGVLLIVAKDDRKLRIEVGYGLEGVIPDAVAKRVIAETITPRFRADDFAGGIEAGVRQLMGLIDGEALPPPAQPSADGGAEGFSPGLLIAGVILGLVLVPLLGRGLASGGAGVGNFGVNWLRSGSLMTAGLMGVGTLLGVLLLGRGGGGGGGRGGGGFGGGYLPGGVGRGWTTGGGLGGFGGGLGGGSWGGGGGGFGGGGASGSW